MNRLWVRLSLTYGSVILIAFLAISFISLQLIRTNAEQVADQQQQALIDRIVTQLATHYQEHENWDDVATVFDQSPDFFAWWRNSFVLEALDGVILYQQREIAPTQTAAASSDIERLEPLPVETDTFPVTVDGAAVAILHMSRPRAPLFPLWGVVRDVGVEEILGLAVIIVGVVSVLFGIMISRWLTNPLDDLAMMAQDIGEGHMERRVQMVGTDETISLARSFNNMVDQLQDAEKQRRNLVADVAHELRTPIAVLQAGLYAILDDAYPMTKTEITGLYEQTRMLGQLVNDLHELSLADANKLPLKCQPLELAKAIEDFVAPFRIVAESEGMTFQVKVEPDLPVVNADESRINQVLHNLLSNALRHNSDGGVITIDVQRSQGEDGVKIVVSDTGNGIASEHLPHVFERFYRDDYGRSRDQGGTGLGLAIARALTEAHHGTLEVASEGIAGKGATFTLWLPA